MTILTPAGASPPLLSRHFFEQAGKDMIGRLRDTATAQAAEFSLFMERLDESKIDACITTFVDTEVDHRTPGDRGLGRPTAIIPRYGAYYRTAFSRLSPIHQADVRLALARYIGCAYVAAAIAYSDCATTDSRLLAEELWYVWIPEAYRTGPLKLGPTYTAVDLLTEPERNSLDAVLKRLGLAPSAFGYLMSAQPRILISYSIAGIVLRLAELELSKPARARVLLAGRR